MKLKNLLPVDRFTLSTRLTGTEVLQRLDGITQPKQAMKFFQKLIHTKPYEGVVDAHHFEIHRVIDYRNSFLPIIKGTITPGQDHTAIRITMRPMGIVLVFMCFWLGVVGLVCLGILIAALVHMKQILRQGFSPGILIPFVLFAFGYGLLMLAYKGESSGSKKFLAQLLEAEEQ